METFDMLPPVQNFHQSHNCLVNWMNGMRASFSLSLENQKSIVWRHKLVAMSATIHLWISASNESTAKLSLGKKQGHLFAEWPLTGREPRLTLSPSYSKALIG